MVCHYCQTRLAYRYVPHENGNYGVCRECHLRWTLGAQAAEIRLLESWYHLSCGTDAQESRGRRSA